VALKHIEKTPSAVVHGPGFSSSFRHEYVASAAVPCDMATRGRECRSIEPRGKSNRSVR
jgi:hypothetical protein